MLTFDRMTTPRLQFDLFVYDTETEKGCDYSVRFTRRLIRITNEVTKEFRQLDNRDCVIPSLAKADEIVKDYFRMSGLF